MLMPLPLTLFGLLLGSTLAAQEPASNSSVAASGKDDCAVSGVVLKQSSNEPLKSARVQLRSADEAEFSTTVVTDAGGNADLIIEQDESSLPDASVLIQASCATGESSSP